MILSSIEATGPLLNIGHLKCTVKQCLKSFWRPKGGFKRTPSNPPCLRACVQTVAHPHLLKGTCKDICPFLLVDKDDDGRVDAAAKEGEQLLSLVCLRHHQHLLLHSLSWLACRRKRERGMRSAEPELRGIIMDGVHTAIRAE